MNVGWLWHWGGKRPHSFGQGWNVTWFVSGLHTCMGLYIIFYLPKPCMFVWKVSTFWILITSSSKRAHILICEMKYTACSVILIIHSKVADLIVSRLFDSGIMKSKLTEKQVYICVCLLSVRERKIERQTERQRERDEEGRQGGREGRRERREKIVDFFSKYFCLFRMHLYSIY